MLTRSQVAHRLGKSIATVRRMEGELLFPVVDGQGVHRFDAEEVELLGEERATRAFVETYRGGRTTRVSDSSTRQQENVNGSLQDRLHELESTLRERDDTVTTLNRRLVELGEALTLSARLTIETIGFFGVNSSHTDLLLEIQGVQEEALRLANSPV